MIPFLPTLMLLLACVRAPPVVDVPAATPAELLATAVAEAPAGPAIATFSIRVQGPDAGVSAQGTALVAPGGRFRLELRGPIGGPAFIAACDGTTLRAWEAGPNRVWEATDLDARLRGATNGALGLDALSELLLLRLPRGLPPPTSTRTRDGRPSFEWAQGGAQLAVDLDAATARVARLGLVGPDGQAWLGLQGEADTSRPSRDKPGPARPPRTLTVVLPPMNTTAELNFGAWTNAAPTDPAFRLALPAGATVEELRLP